MLRRPGIFALVVFVSILALGTAVFYLGDLFPPGVIRPSDRGQFIGKTVGAVALLAAVGAYFFARRKPRG